MIDQSQIVWPVGTLVRVLSARHPDINAGTVGSVACVYEGGYGVKLHAAWLLAGSDRGACVNETRVIWYPPNELEVAS